MVDFAVGGLKALRARARERTVVLAERMPLLHGRLADVVRVLVERNLRVRYRGSALGILWSALNPLLMAVVYAAIFGRTFAAYYGGSLVAYGAAVYIGLSLVGFFIGATTQSVPSIVQNGGLLNKIQIPSEAFPLSVLLAYGFQQLVATVPILAVVSIAVNHDPVHLVLLVIPLTALALFTTGVALVVSGAHVFFRDVSYLYELATFVLWVTSPVFYPAAIVPERLAHFLILNPLYPILESARELVLATSLPSPALLGLATLEALVTLGLGIAAFRAMRSHFMDRL